MDSGLHKYCILNIVETKRVVEVVVSAASLPSLSVAVSVVVLSVSVILRVALPLIAVPP